MVNPIHFINVNYECYYFAKELANVISHSWGNILNEYFTRMKFELELFKFYLYN